MTDQLEEEKVIECKEVFDLFDKDKDGAITTKELGDVMLALGANPTQPELQEMINEVDQDGTGKIEFNVFLELFSRKMKEPITEEDLIEAFKIFKQVGDRAVSANELRHVMTTLGDRLTDEEADEMIKEAGVDENGIIHYDNYVKMIMNKWKNGFLIIIRMIF